MYVKLDLMQLSRNKWSCFGLFHQLEPFPPCSHKIFLPAEVSWQFFNSDLKANLKRYKSFVCTYCTNIVVAAFSFLQHVTAFAGGLRESFFRTNTLAYETKGINDTSGACEKHTFRYLLQLYLLNCFNPYRKVFVSYQFWVVVQTYPGLLTHKKKC